MAVAVITGSGTYALPGLDGGEEVPVGTPFGDVLVTRGMHTDVPVLHVARHGAGHLRLSNTINHRANIWALKQLGAEAVIGLTVCGAVDPTLELGSLVVFDDLWFQSNRLPDGSLCTFFTEVGDPARGHWVLHGGPFSESLQKILIDAAVTGENSFQAGGVYGHVDGPRFNTPAEIAELASFGVAAVSQTGGPETVLCGELELPFALVGFVTDYANDVMPGEPTAVEALSDLMVRSSDVFREFLAEALPRVGQAAADAIKPAGTMFRFGGS